MSFGIPGGAWVARMEPSGAYENIQNHLLLLGFEHLEVLGRALGIPLGPWGLLWGALEGLGGALGSP